MSNSKHLNRWIYAALGVLILVFAGLIYAWSVLSSPIATEFSDWSKGSLSLTFTLAMSFFCLGGLVAGLVAGKIKERFTVKRIMNKIFETYHQV